MLQSSEKYCSVSQITKQRLLWLPVLLLLTMSALLLRIYIKNKVSVIGLSDGQGIERENCFSCPKDLCDSGTLLKGENCIFESKK